MEELLFLEVNGIKLAYTKTGQGNPLILVHGNGEEHSIFDESVQLLKEHFTCYCLDSRGHGESSPVEEYHYQDMADDVDAFIHALGLKEVTFCGFSDGGIIGLLLAQKNKEIKNLIVCGANTDPLGVKGSVLTVMRILYALKKDPKVFLMLSEPDISEEQLASIQAKTLVVAGQKDLIRLEHTRKIAAAIPGSTSRIVRGEGHGSYIVHSDKLGKLILKWFHIS